MGSPLLAWALPAHEPVPPTLMGLLQRLPALAETILDHVLEEDIAYQVRPVYHAINPLTHIRDPAHVPVPTRTHVDVQVGRTVKLDGNTTGLVTRRAARFRIEDNPFRTFIEHNPWQADDASASLHNAVPQWLLDQKAHSEFLSVRLVCHEMYLCAWRVAVRHRHMMVQVLGFGVPDLRNVISSPGRKQALLRHPRIDNLETRIDTLILAPTFDTAVDYSAMVQNLPNLRWVIPGSVHIRWPDPVLFPGAYFSASYFYCGLVTHQQEALDWLLALVGHLVRPRLFVRANQKVTIVRQISLNSAREPQEPTLNLMVAYDVPHTLQEPNEPYIIYAGLDPSQQPANNPPFRIMWPAYFIRTAAEKYLKGMAELLARDDGTVAALAPVNNILMGFHMGTALNHPDPPYAAAVWQAYSGHIKNLFPAFNIPDYVHWLYSNMEEVLYLFHRG